MSLNTLFAGVSDSSLQSTITITNFIACIGISLILGLFLAITYTYKTKYSKSFVVTMAVLPAVVCMVIMMVNGNLGTGVAVAGAFSLVRFRSIPGTAKEIGAIFIAMATGLATGMGYLGYAILFALVLGLISILYTKIPLGEKQDTARTMRITIPEDLNYSTIFNEIFDKYTTCNELTNVKTTNMGSLFKLTYNFNLLNADSEKAFIDDLRLRNGNLEINISKQDSLVGDL